MKAKGAQRDTIVALALLGVVAGVIAILYVGTATLGEGMQSFLSLFDRSPFFWIGLSLTGSGAFAVFWREK